MKERSNMAKRRSNGEGTLRLRADGRWEMTIMDGFRDDGKRRFKTFYGKTQKEVKAKAKGYRDAKDSGLLVDVNYLFPEWADIWFEHHRDNIAPTTQENYRYTLRILNEGFARRRIADVKPYDIEMFLKNAMYRAAPLTNITPNIIRRCNIVVANGKRKMEYKE